MRARAWCRPLVVACSLLPAVGVVVAESAEPVVSEVVVAAPVEAVWDAFTTREGMQAWVNATIGEMSMQVGDTWRSSYDRDSNLDDDSVIETELLAFDPGRMMAARTRKPPADFPFPNAILSTWYVVYLEPVDAEHTKVVHKMFGFTDDDESQKMREFFAWGNQYDLDRLAAHFAGSSQ